MYNIFLFSSRNLGYITRNACGVLTRWTSDRSSRSPFSTFSPCLPTIYHRGYTDLPPNSHSSQPINVNKRPGLRFEFQCNVRVFYQGNDYECSMQTETKHDRPKTENSQDAPASSQPTHSTPLRIVCSALCTSGARNDNRECDRDRTRVRTRTETADED